MASVVLEAADYQPVIVKTVEETLRQIQADETLVADRLAYPEKEAATLLGIKSHVLRDCRRRGEIAGSLVGKRFLYERGELLQFLRNRRVG